MERICAQTCILISLDQKVSALGSLRLGGSYRHTRLVREIGTNSAEHALFDDCRIQRLQQITCVQYSRGAGVSHRRFRRV
jgi:hypothetical protein